MNLKFWNKEDKSLKEKNIVINVEIIRKIAQEYRINNCDKKYFTSHYFYFIIDLHYLSFALSA